MNTQAVNLANQQMAITTLAKSSQLPK